MAHSEPPSTEPLHKRKRDVDDTGQRPRDRIPQPPPPQSGDGAHINYLSRATSTRLKLLQGDGEVFREVVKLIGEYEGVLSRHESLAANLGAKLTGPRLVRAMEGLFEEPLRITRRDPYIAEPVAWLDVVQYAKSNPSEFTLIASPDRGRYCTCYLKGNQIEITEDDWRLIKSGTLDRFNLAPPQPLEEDEDSELATIEILEQRLQVLIKKADEVARKARQLKYHLSGRKAAIDARRIVPSPPIRNAGFQPLNHQHSQASSSKSKFDLRADLLQQFTSSQPSRIPGQTSMSLPTTPVIPHGPHNSKMAVQTTHPSSSRPSPGVPDPQQSQQRSVTQSYDPADAHRPLITARIEKLAKGDTIYPPCDRCRRLRVLCIKHLTACQGCTKKHAKCSWKGMMDEEVAWLKRETSNANEVMDAGEGGSGSGGRTPDPQPVISNIPLAPPTNNGDRADMRIVAAPNTTSNGNGVGAGDMRSQERNITDFGLREQHPSSPSRADPYRLSHMANVVLNAEVGEQQQQPQPPPPPPPPQQQQHSQNAIFSGASAPRDERIQMPPLEAVLEGKRTG
ncbi:hypothetical protein VM1G_08124 [Cytospora mali]|uniref:Zn(2)-C6 fungal-type domain-containing protein n=1 Tax=Cytospora mali TaxID=578113 RepID=A0A194W8A3_CYTMA|nr:hypothetical protein VM1G_08124 [Valsa mali]